jgi:hypothetical protein
MMICLKEKFLAKMKLTQYLSRFIVLFVQENILKKNVQIKITVNHNSLTTSEKILLKIHNFSK